MIPLMSASVLLCGSPPICADPLESTEIHAKIKEIRVPVRELPRWLRQGWQPVRRDKYSAFRKANRATGDKVRQTAPAVTRIHRAEYSARVVGTSLRAGRVTAEVTHDGSLPELLSLEPLNLAVPTLKWTDREAVWGTTPGGTTALLVDRPSGYLEGSWELKGRKLGHNVEFDVRLAPATVSQLVLRIPNGQTLTSSAGAVSGPKPADETGWARWQISLGSTSVCRLAVSRSGSHSKSQPVVLADSVTTHVIRPEGLELEARYTLEVLETSIDTLTFLAPAEIDVFSITYGGDSPLNWKVDQQEDQRRIVVRLPDALHGQSRPIRIRGFGPTVIGKPWELPHLKLEDAVFLRGQQHLKVASTLVLQPLLSVGQRQTAIVSDPSEGDSLTFLQYRGDARMTVEVNFPRLDVKAQVVSHVNATDDNWMLTSEIEWQARSGSTFAARCLLPEDWEITGVRMVANASAPAEVNWNVNSRDDGRHLLVLDFADALNPDAPKRVRIEAHHAPPSKYGSTRFPIAQPLDVSSLEMLSLFSYPPTALPILEPDSTFQVIGTNDLPGFASTSPLWQEIESKRSPSTKTLFATSVEPTGGFFLKNSEVEFDAHVDVTHDVGVDRVSESFVATVIPTSESIDHLFVFLTAQGVSPDWTLLGEESRHLTATRIPLSRHPAWNLPESGELWELHLPGPVDGSIRISAVWTKILDRTDVATLVFFPQSREFFGTAQLMVEPGVDLNFQSEGLEPIELNPTTARLRNETKETGPTVHTWRYSRFSDQVVLQALNQGDSLPREPLALLRLRSVIFPGGQGQDLHHAEYLIEGDSSSDHFRFTMPEAAKLVNVRLNGRSFTPSHQEQDILLPQLAPNQRNVVEIHYLSRSAGNLLRNSRDVLLPQVSHTILSFDWEFALPAGVWLEGNFEQVHLMEPLTDLSWSQRLFGPLGRSRDSRIFNPFRVREWRQLFSGTPPRDDAAGPGQGFAPVGWIVRRAVAPSLPETLVLQTWSFDRGCLLAWSGTLFCIMIGLALRLRRLSIRPRIARYFAALCPLLVWFLPPPYALIVGGCLVGAVISLLIPRRFLVSLHWPSIDGEPNVSDGAVSTQQSAAYAVLLIAAALTAGLLRGELLAQNKENAAAVSADEGPPDEFTVVIPIEDKSEARATLPVVYVKGVLRDRLEKIQSDDHGSANYLISSVDYRGQIDNLGSATIDLHCKIAFLSQEPHIRVLLPIANANFGHADDCLVNGRPHPIFLVPDGTGYVIELKNPATARNAADTANSDSAAETGEAIDGNTQPVTTPSLNPPAARPPLEMADLRLRLRPWTATTPDGGSLQIGIPAVASSRLSLELDPSLPAIDIIGAQGESVVSGNGSSVTTPLGKTKQLQLTWSKNAAAVPSPAEVAASIVCLVDARPNWLRLRYLVKHRVLKGNVEHVRWRIPPQMILRSVRAPGRSAVSHSRLDENQSQLHVEFAEPLEEDFAIDATFLLPLDPPDDEIRVPAVDLFPTDADGPNVQVTMSQLGVSTSSEFHLTPIMTDSIAAIPTDSLMPPASSGTAIKRPQFAYQLSEPGELSFRIAPRNPRHAVWQEQVAVIGRRQIQWRLNADVGTTESPAFRHTLVISPEVRIESVSVQQDQADRLARWVRNGDRLDLFLNDRATGIQNVSVKGTIPVKPTATVRLPLSRFAQTETVESNLILYHDADVDARIVEDGSLVALERALDPETGELEQVLIGQFRITPDDDAVDIRIEQSDGRIHHFDTLTFVEPTSNSQWSVSTTLRFPRSITSVPQVVVHIPQPLAQNYQLHGQQIEARTDYQADGSVDLILRRKVKRIGGFSATVASSLPAPADDWKLSTVTLREATQRDGYLLLPADSPFQPEMTNIAALSPGAFPEWISDAVAKRSSEKQWRAYRSDTTSWKLSAEHPRTSSTEASIPLVRTQLWLHTAVPESGCTEVLLRRIAGPKLDFSWPAELQLQGLFLDGSRTAARHFEEGRLSVLIEAPRQPHLLRLFWTRVEATESPPVGAVSWKVPLPMNLPVERSLVTAAGPRGSWFFNRSGFESLGRLDYSLKWLEGLRDTSSGDRDGYFPSPEVWRSLGNANKRLRAGLSDLKQPSSESAAEEATLEQCGAISRLIDDRYQLAETTSSSKHNEEGWNADALESAWVDTAQGASRVLLLGRLTHDSAVTPLKFWVINTQIGVWALAISISVAVLLVVGRLVNTGIGGWLDAHPVVAWGLLGCFWWLCLIPSAAGLLLILTAFASMFLRRGQPAQKTSATALKT
jgi:hypothetical protein